jgi:hypothetical protein
MHVKKMFMFPYVTEKVYVHKCSRLDQQLYYYNPQQKHTCTKQPKSLHLCQQEYQSSVSNLPKCWLKFEQLPSQLAFLLLLSSHLLSCRLCKFTLNGTGDTPALIQKVEGQDTYPTSTMLIHASNKAAHCLP